MAAIEVAGLAVEARGVALADPDLAGQDQRLGLGSRLGQPPLDEQLVEADGRFARAVAVASGSPPIVAQRAHRGLTRRVGSPDRCTRSEPDLVRRAASVTWSRPRTSATSDRDARSGRDGAMQRPTAREVARA